MRDEIIVTDELERLEKNSWINGWKHAMIEVLKAIREGKDLKKVCEEMNENAEAIYYEKKKSRKPKTDA